MRNKTIYKGYWIKPVYKYCWCVYEPGLTSKDTPGARCGTVYPDIKISNNMLSVDACKEFIDRWIERNECNI